MHNTFDVEMMEDGVKVSSHNFPGCEGVGKDLAEASTNLSRAIMHLKDNNPQKYNEFVQKRVKSKLYCLCGTKLKDNETYGVNAVVVN